MDDLTKLQDELKQIILTFEEKASGNKIDNKHLIKQFTGKNYHSFFISYHQR